MGCLFRLGCLVVLLIVGVVAFLTRDRWMKSLPWRSAATETSVITTSDWKPLSEAGAKRTRDALATLSSKSGPVFVTLAGSDVASYIFLQLSRAMPASTDSFAARVDGDRIRLRANMKTSDLGSSVGALGALLGERERVEMSGHLSVIAKGLAQFRVTEVRVHDMGIPNALVSRLVRPLVRGPRPPELAADGLPIAIPSYVGDVRVANGKITLYKNVQ